MNEIRSRNAGFYIDDLAMGTRNVPEAVFGFTLEELYAIRSWIPNNDTFSGEIDDAITELEMREVKDE